MAKKARKTKKNTDMTKIALLLIGLVFVSESLALVVMLSLIGTLVTKTAIAIGWLYAFVKLFAGLVAMYSGSRK